MLPFSVVPSLRTLSCPVIAFCLTVLLPSCTIDFDAPFAETWWAAPGHDASSDVTIDGPVDASSERYDAPAEDASDAPSSPCEDGERNGRETDVDCGGGECPACLVGRHCVTEEDCESAPCVDGVCCESDCSGLCLACSAVKTGQPDGTCAFVSVGSDPDQECSGGYGCRQGMCESCQDGMQDGDETWVDCGGACAPCSEICTNGVDDDGNGLTDCEDPLCGSYACVPEAPDGWDGPAWLHVGTDDPFCEGSRLVLDGGLGAPSFSAANCSNCSCSEATGATCPLPTVELFDSTSCSGDPYTTQIQQAGACTTVDDPVEFDSGRVVPSGPQGGSCAASGGSPTLQDPTWGSRGVVCDADLAQSGAGCGGTSVCLAEPPSPYLGRFCFHRPGDVPCPNGSDARYVVFGGWTDARGCSPCECSDPAGVCEDGSVRVFGNAFCSLASNTVPMDGACTQLSGGQFFTSIRFEDGGVPSGIQCTASGGEPMGTVSPTDPVTVCCPP